MTAARDWSYDPDRLGDWRTEHLVLHLVGLTGKAGVPVATELWKRALEAENRLELLEARLAKITATAAGGEVWVQP